MSVAKAGAGQPVAASGRERSDRLWAVLFVAPQAIGLIVFALVPLVFSFVLGFMRWAGLGDKAWFIPPEKNPRIGVDREECYQAPNAEHCF